MMKLKKVILSLFLPLLVIGCSVSDKNISENNDKLKVLSTTAQIHDLTKAIGGDRIDAKILIRGDLDPHSYEIVKGDGEKLSTANLIFYNGLGLEHGASLSSFLQNSSKAIPLGDRIRAAYPDRILKKEGVTDPHIWMDISLWQKGIDPIVQALSEADPVGAPLYRQRAEALTQRMDQAHNALYARLQKIPQEKRYLVTSHDAFRYFTRTYLADPKDTNWESRFAAPEGLAPEGQLNPKDIQKIINFLKAKGIEVLFPESNVSRDSIRKIASAGKELGLEIRICSEPLYGDAMGGLGYLEMMEKNGETIARCLWTPQ